MKQTASVVIVGGGIVGCSLAARLAMEMKDVVLVEKTTINNYASSSNFGMVWLQSRYPGFDTEMSRLSQIEYEYNIENGIFDVDIEYEKRGGLTVAFTDEQIKVMKKQCEKKQKSGTPMCILNREDTLRLEPHLNPEIAGSIFCGDDARINPLKTALAYANLAVRRGACLYRGVEVTGITQEHGHVTGVKTNKGDISTPLVINCCGAWARSVAAMAGVDLPVYPQRLQALVTEPMLPMMSRIVQVARDIDPAEGSDVDPEKVTGFMFEYHGKPIEENLPQLPVEDTIFTYVQQSLSDTVVIGTTNEFVGHNVKTTPKALSAMLKAATRILPELNEANIIRTWASVLPFTFDGLPIVGKVKEVEGFLLAAGHGHAMCHAPALANQMADYILRGYECDLMKQASIERF